VSRRGFALFAAMCVIWGIPYLLIRVAVRDLSPAMLVLGRTSLAALLLLPIAAARGHLRPLLPYWRAMLVFTAIEIAIPWVLLGTAEQHVSSSLTGLLIAATPLVGVAVARERVGLHNAIGLGLGVLGVAAIVGLNLEGTSPLPFAEIGAVAVCYAVGPAILQRRLAHLPALGVIAASLALTAIAFLPIAAFSFPHELPSGDVVGSVVALAVVCTAVAFLLFFALIGEIGPARATVITYVNPAVAAVAGVAFLDERFTAGMGVGFALVLAGSVLATRPSRGPEAAAALASGGSGSTR
jgi:drug/metabolite transporter (DMT)-like permease